MRNNIKNTFWIVTFAIVVFIALGMYEYKTRQSYHILSFQDPKTQLYGFKGSDGEILINAQYQNTDTDTLYALAIVQKDNEWVGINTENEIVLKPFIFDNGPDYVSEGLFRFVENGKIGFADEDGNKVIPAGFDFVTPFEGGRAEYAIGGTKQYEGEHWTWVNAKEKGFINQKGEKIDRH